MWQTTLRGSHLHHDIEVIPLSLNVSHTYHIQQTTDAKKTRRCYFAVSLKPFSINLHVYRSCYKDNMWVFIHLYPISSAVLTAKVVFFIRAAVPRPITGTNEGWRKRKKQSTVNGWISSQLQISNPAPHRTFIPIKFQATLRSNQLWKKHNMVKAVLNGHPWRMAYWPPNTGLTNLRVMQENEDGEGANWIPILWQNDLKLFLPLLVPNERKKKTIKCQA